MSRPRLRVSLARLMVEGLIIGIALAELMGVMTLVGRWRAWW